MLLLYATQYLSTLHLLIHLILTQPQEVNTIIIPILQWWNWEDSNSSKLIQLISDGARIWTQAI